MESYKLQELYNKFLNESENREAINDYGRNKKDYLLLEACIYNWGIANSYNKYEINGLSQFINNQILSPND
jgi:hypothetical protein